jgi:beta-glucosidase
LFCKTHLLQPGDTEKLKFMIDAKALASFDTQKEAWIADAGTYTVSIGASSKDIKGTATFTLPAQTLVEQDEQVLMPQVAITELKK